MSSSYCSFPTGRIYQPRKVLVVGAPASGKTAWLHRLFTGRHRDYYIPTRSADKYFMVLYFLNPQNQEITQVQFELWDVGLTLDAEPELLEQTYRGAQGCLCFVEANQTPTQENFFDYCQQVAQVAGQIPLLCVPSKADLRDKPPSDSISAFTGQGVYQPLLELARYICQCSELELVMDHAKRPLQIPSL